MKRIALLLALLIGTAYAAGPPAPYFPKPHVVWDEASSSMAVTLQPTMYGAALISPSGNGNDWTPATGTGTQFSAGPNAYVGLLLCSANCSSAYGQTWVPATSLGGGGGGTPGGSPNSLQYNNAGAFGGVLNGTSTRKFLLQTTGAPFFDLLQSADLPAATNAAQGAVQLASGQTSSILSKVATTGNYTDLNGVPAAPISSSGLTALYEFNETTGTTLNDFSGNGNNGTITGSLTRDGYGYTFTAATGQYIDLPSQLNSSPTIHIFVNFPIAVTGSYANYSTSPILSNSTPSGSSGFEIWSYNTSSTTATTSGAGLYSLNATSTVTGAFIGSTDSQWTGPHVVSVVCPVGAKPNFYLDGYPINDTWTGTVTSCNSLQSVGNFRFGQTARNNNTPQTFTYYGAAFYSTIQTPAQVAATANALRAIAIARGVQVTPINILTPTANYYAAGDSITCSFPLPGCATGVSSPVGYPYIATTLTNKTYIPTPLGVPGDPVAQAVVTEPYRAWPQCRSANGSSINSLFMGTNDFGSLNVSGATVSDIQASYAAGSKAAGCRPFLIGMLSRSGNANGGTSWDTRMLQKNAEDRAQWANWGYQAYVDWVTDPLLGIPGAFQGAVPFTCTLTSGQNTCILTSGTLIPQNYGGIITGTGMQTNTTLTSVSGSTVTFSLNATASGSQSLTVTGNTYTIDGTHPTATAGYNRVGAAVACIINGMDGSSPSQMNPTTVTASSTATCADGGRLIDATAGNVVYTLPTAMYQTGRKVRYCNVTPSGTNTVTLAAPSDFPFNNISGNTSITISANTCSNLEATWNGLTTTSTGAYWRQN